jgi:biotin carboxyl carrier protein
VDAGAVETLKSKTGGKVASVAVADGAIVTRGQTLVTFDSGADPGEIANLQDRIASLENSEDEEAKRDLKAARQKLAALEGGRGAAPLVATSNGKLTGFSVMVGDVLRAGEVVGRIGEAEAPTRVRVTIPRSLRVRSSEAVTLVLKDGSNADGSVVAVSGRTVVVSTGSIAAELVAAVRF